ncbi:MAG: cyclase family protein [Oscillospiraceae bacterium]|nr:cyclase family protein [Oscillospiraceae bacterium]
MKIYDITRPLQDAPVYPGSKPPQLERLRDVERGDEYSITSVTADSHAGTHADAFSHYLAGGASIDQMPLEQFCGTCRVLTVPPDDLIKADDLRGRLDGAERLALHGGGNAFLCEEAAEYIAEQGIRLLLTDAWSVGPLDNETRIHKTLLRGGVAIIENALLDDVPDGDYLVFAFPAKYRGCDGAPVRAVLLQGETQEPAPTDAKG